MDPRTFLTALWGKKPPGDILIWMLPQKLSRWYISFDHLNQDLRAYPERDLYTGVGFPAPGTTKLVSNQRCITADIGALTGMWADIDVAHPIHKRANLTPTLEQALGTLEQFPFEPTITIDSGHGLQAWWLFEKPWIFKSEEDNLTAQKLAQWWNKEIQALYDKQGWTVDSVYDLARVLRIPDTFNNKIPEERVPVKTIRKDGPRYQRETFLDQVPPDFRPIPTVSRSRITREVKGNGLVISPDAQPPPDKLINLMDSDPKFRASWKGERKDMTDQSTSGYDMSLASIAINNGWTDQETVDLMIAWRRNHGYELKLRENYYEVTIIKARGPIEQAEAQEQLKESLFTETEDQAEILKTTLSTLFGVGIIKIIKYEGDPPTFRMITDESDITIGSVGNLVNQKNFRELVAAATGTLIPKCKGDTWEQRAQALLRASETVSVGDESNPATETRSWVETYLSERTITDDVNQAANTKKPFQKNGHTYIFLHDFRRWVENNAGEKLTGNALGQRLRMCRAEPESIDVLVGDHRSSRSCWRVPT